MKSHDIHKAMHPLTHPFHLATFTQIVCHVYNDTHIHSSITCPVNIKPYTCYVTAYTRNQQLIIQRIHIAKHQDVIFVIKLCYKSETFAYE